ncbi:MAG: site-2 protease family protein [Sedimentisphaerales bacterium]|nr:site-2 protease family protein [Sedimentisphaerales bacterium]
MSKAKEVSATGETSPKGGLEQYIYAILWTAILAGVVYFAVRNIRVFGNILLVALGFGAFVLVHEFGHFLLAKLAGIKVEAFSIGFPPILAGILRTEMGWRIRILPQFFPKGDGSDDGRLSFAVGKKPRQAGETEYRIGAIPFGGFVKMLGQEDVGPVKESDDPRSFANKSVGARMAVIAAGVVFNAISAVIVFMIVFLIGINRVPAVIGGVVADSPAARAGLTAGDEIIEIAGKSKNLDFYDVAIAAALSRRDEKISLKARHKDGNIRDYVLTAEKKPDSDIKEFGIISPQSLTIAKVSDANELLEKTGLRPGDRIKSVEGREVESYWEFEETARKTLAPTATVTAEREGGYIEASINLNLVAAELKGEGETETGHICSMVPRLRLEAVSKKPLSIFDKLKSLLSGKKDDEDHKKAEELKSGDIILAAGDIENPTYKELRDVTTNYEDREMSIRVLREDNNGKEKEVTITATPKRLGKDGRVVIGISLLPVFDAEHPVVAKTISTEDWPVKLDIPRGAVITAVDKVKVSSFYDVVRELRRKAGKRVTISYRAGEKTTGGVTLEVKADEDFAAVKSACADFIPLRPLERLYKASGPVDAIVMGYKKAVMFIAQAYITLKGLVTGLFSPKGLMGPVGILTFSYRIVAERPLIDYAYFLGLISASLAVFNILPLLPFDGGFIVFLLIEKIKGSPVSVRIQEKIASLGWVLVLALILYVTFNDIVRSFFS